MKQHKQLVTSVSYNSTTHSYPTTPIPPTQQNKWSNKMRPDQTGWFEWLQTSFGASPLGFEVCCCCCCKHSNTDNVRVHRTTSCKSASSIDDLARRCVQCRERYVRRRRQRRSVGTLLLLLMCGLCSTTLTGVAAEVTGERRVGVCTWMDVCL